MSEMTLVGAKRKKNQLYCVRIENVRLRTTLRGTSNLKVSKGLDRFIPHAKETPSLWTTLTKILQEKRKMQVALALVMP